MRRPKPRAALKHLVDEGVQIAEMAKDEKQRFPGGLSYKLGAVAYATAALREAGTNQQRLIKLRATCQKPRWESVRGALNAMVNWMKTPEVGHPLNVKQVQRALDANQGAAGRLAAGTYSPDELMALAAQIATEQAPEAFGLIDDPEEHQAQIDARAARMHELEDQIAAEVTLDDLREDHSDLTEWQTERAGFTKFVLRVWPEVAYTPTQTLGRRLIQFVTEDKDRRLRKPEADPSWVTAMLADEADMKAKIAPPPIVEFGRPEPAPVVKPESKPAAPTAESTPLESEAM